MLAVINHSHNVLEKWVSKNRSGNAQSRRRYGNAANVLTSSSMHALREGAFASERKEMLSILPRKTTPASVAPYHVRAVDDKRLAADLDP
jgi:hypothetical protein